MNIDEFQKQQPPRAKRSKLEPFIKEIRELKEKGYANWQVCEWLSSNEVKISIAGFRKYWIKKQGEDGSRKEGVSAGATVQARRATPTTAQPGQAQPGQTPTRAENRKRSGPLVLAPPPKKWHWDPLERPVIEFIDKEEDK